MPPKIRIEKRINKSLDNTKSKLNKSLDNTESKLKKAGKTQDVIGRKYVKSAAMIQKEADKGVDAYDMLKKIVNDPKIKL